MLSDIVDAAVRSKGRWCPRGAEEDFRQEAWLAACEAVDEGYHDPDEIRRRVELRLKQFIRKERQATDPAPMSSLPESDEEA